MYALYRRVNKKLVEQPICKASIQELSHIMGRQFQNALAAKDCDVFAHSIDNSNASIVSNGSKEEWYINRIHNPVLMATINQ